ncbi:MAG TPA: adenosine deaminase [Candidatus Polarisedimenticolia bacterium]|nr:adenosine deaminase [Candidatus Polarisedimenticolia bacterium]
MGRIPLLDLHLHLEGSIPSAALRRLAARHRAGVPDLAFDGFTGFLRAFGRVCDLLRDRRDFELAAWSVFERWRALGADHVEVRFSPQAHLRRGVSLTSILDGVLLARARAERRGGMSVALVADGVRQWGPDWFDQVVRSLAPWAGRGIEAVGMGGDERAFPARIFAPAFRLARRLGFRSTVHAGETEGAASVRSALCLGADRIGHGARAVEDPDLVRLLARRGTPLELCPGSNVATGVVPSLAEHPLPLLLRAGVRVTLGSDDGALFGTDIARERRRAVRAFGLSRREQALLARHAVEAAFLSDGRRRRLLARVLRAEPSLRMRP